MVEKKLWIAFVALVSEGADISEPPTSQLRYVMLLPCQEG